MIIADRIDTTRKHVAHAIASRNERFLQSEVKAQQQAGADYIGLQLTPNAISNDPDLTWLMDSVQQTSDLPLCLSGANREALLQILPRLTTPPMVNLAGLSVLEISETLAALPRYRAKAMLPILFGGDLSSDDGAERGDVKQLSEMVAEHGLAPDEVYGLMQLDSLSANGPAAREALVHIAQAVRSDSGFGLVCRPAEVSRGLRQRALIEQAFTVAAVTAGVSAVIIDPTDRRMSELVQAALMVVGKTPRDSRLLERFS